MERPGAHSPYAWLAGFLAGVDVRSVTECLALDAVSQKFLRNNGVKSQEFPSPTGYMLISFSFSFMMNVREIALN